jgi:pimeloyl-ACP methyl ester carboxylesterase
MSEATGKVDFTVGDDTYQTWYKIVGDLASGSHPLVVLHGGPGISHEYMTPLAEIHNKCNIPVIFYDQIGIGKSVFEGVAEKPKEFWTVDLFMDELDNLLVHLGVQNGFALLGHSWGAMLGAHYASHRHPVGLKHLVLTGGAPSMALWEKSTDQLLNALPEDVRETIKRHEQGPSRLILLAATLSIVYERRTTLVNFWMHENSKKWDSTADAQEGFQRGSIPFLEHKNGDPITPSEQRAIMKLFRADRRCGLVWPPTAWDSTDLMGSSNP